MPDFNQVFAQRLLVYCLLARCHYEMIHHISLGIVAIKWLVPRHVKVHNQQLQQSTLQHLNTEHKESFYICVFINDVYFTV